MSVPAGYKSELLNSEECKIMRRASDGFFRSSSYVKVDPAQMYSILVQLDKGRIAQIAQLSEIAELKASNRRLQAAFDYAEKIIANLRSVSTETDSEASK